MILWAYIKVGQLHPSGGCMTQSGLSVQVPRSICSFFANLVRALQEVILNLVFYEPKRVRPM